MNIECAAVNVQRGVSLNSVAVNINIECAAVDCHRACGLGVDNRSLGFVCGVGSTLNSVVCGFDYICALVDYDTSVAGYAIVDSRAGGCRSVVF